MERNALWDDVIKRRKERFLDNVFGNLYFIDNLDYRLKTAKNKRHKRHVYRITIDTILHALQQDLRDMNEGLIMSHAVSTILQLQDKYAISKRIKDRIFNRYAYRNVCRILTETNEIYNDAWEAWVNKHEEYAKEHYGTLFGVEKKEENKNECSHC